MPTRFLHDCRRTAARNLIRASVAERVAMLLTGHKSRAIFDRYNIINEQELLEAGDQLVAYLAQHAQATPRGGRAHPARTAAPGRTRPAHCEAHSRPTARDPAAAATPPPRRRTKAPTQPRGAPDWHWGGRGSRLTDRRHGGASASHASRGHRGSQPPTHLP